jgi:hypothetical protein
MAADERPLVAERQLLRPDRRDQRLVFAVREICAADGAAEQHVAHDQELLRAVDEHDRAGRVPGAVPDLELVAADRDGVASWSAIGRDVDARIP